MGAVSLIVIWYVGNVVALSETGINPESKPTCPLVDVNVNARQGVAKVDCVTVWFLTYGGGFSVCFNNGSNG